MFKEFGKTEGNHPRTNTKTFLKAMIDSYQFGHIANYHNDYVGSFSKLLARLF